jgi:hypothetical protein
MDYRPVQWLQSSRTMWRRDAAPRVSAPIFSALSLSTREACNESA